MDADPTARYLKMYWAMRDGRLAEARQHAEELKLMLDQGIGPPLYSDVEVRAYLASVLRRTAGVRDDESDAS
jgi:hypothetical protein